MNKFQTNRVFALEKFKDYTLSKSLIATARESVTTHKLEYLADGYKGIFFISNYLGGVYHLTVDEVYIQGNVFVLQESKNSSKGQMPSEDDIKDGLFKLILFGNLECLRLEGQIVEFTTCLKLTGKIQGFLHLPSDRDTIESFCQANNFNKRKKQIIQSLDAETKQNIKLKILITSNE